MTMLLKKTEKMQWSRFKWNFRAFHRRETDG